jgi:DNA repair photolyase
MASSSLRLGSGPPPEPLAGRPAGSRDGPHGRSGGRADRAPQIRRGPAVSDILAERRRGRGAQTNPSGRFEAERRQLVDDGWQSLADLPAIRTDVQDEQAKRIITRNSSPDISFDRSINPYRGCEHGCAYCYARSSHAFMGLSPGLDFETRLFAKPNAAALLECELAEPRYRPATIAIGTNTDPYQPIEKQRRITRSILDVLERTNHPVGIVTKSALVTRDIDILGAMAERGLAKVAISLTSLDRKLARAMEPRAAAPHRRLAAMAALSEAGIPVTVMTAPVIPALNDMELERLLDAARAAGASEAGYVLLRLPLEVAPLFREWLTTHYPDRADHVLSLMQSMRGGKDYDSAWGERMRGSGPYAWQIGRRFELATRRLGLNAERVALRSDLFTPPVPVGGQLPLI